MNSIFPLTIKAGIHGAAMANQGALVAKPNLPVINLKAGNIPCVAGLPSGQFLIEDRGARRFRSRADVTAPASVRTGAIVVMSG